ncbi:uncharacterized protein K452DRAFT_330038 [Aplosporella prunicola CBS 121167]|uniref:NADH-ubiquinone oxidoreductase chain 2 n=1 Tax=Aplosporella prunicola CBS 121167 TaxID=1176127 RepID=A0A6A6AW08_9PEZI|nr:uncharacterized protein K452DRAFT_330038 [Aplosporella prunicola CBS 121167]KAF2135786.1 hypothetical protein K452DRAFT_330038 [Aplosporella prunicola CBS 121167]
MNLENDQYQEENVQTVYLKEIQFGFTNISVSLFLLSITSIILGLNSFYNYENIVNSSNNNTISEKNLLKIKKKNLILEHPLIVVFIITGSFFLITSGDLISLFLALELQSYGLNSETSTKAGLIYFLLGGLSSAIILLGQSLIYANSANTNLDGLYILTAIQTSFNTNDLNLEINYAMVIMSVGFLFKVNVYDYVPTLITLFISLIPKISILILFLEFVYFTVSSIISMVIGSVLGISQYRIKRILAYSTISHLGFILLGLTIIQIESIQGFFFYLIQYIFTNLNGFIILITIDKLKTEINLKELENSPIQIIKQLRGLYKKNIILALSLRVPPLIGFFAKQMILSAALDKGFLFLVIIAIISSVITNDELKINSYMSIIISLLTIISFIFIVIPDELLR